MWKNASWNTYRSLQRASFVLPILILVELPRGMDRGASKRLDVVRTDTLSSATAVTILVQSLQSLDWYRPWFACRCCGGSHVERIEILTGALRESGCVTTLTTHLALLSGLA